MTLTKRIIPCLDVSAGKTVKGIHFKDMAIVGDPIVMARFYADEGADELVFLDISATIEQRKTFAKLVSQIAHEIDIPFTVGGGIQSISDVEVLLKAGADKISINSAALNNPQLLTELNKQFGSQCIVLAVDSKLVNGVDYVFSEGGRVNTGIKTMEWVKFGENCGVGEVLLTSIDHDGTQNGFAIELLDKIINAVKVPVIASGGAGNAKHFNSLFSSTDCDAALAASIFHNGNLSLPDLKISLKNNKINVRL